MSVTLYQNAYVVPIRRTAGYPPKEPAIIARWHGLIEATGDGTGGTITAGIYMGQDTSQMFGIGLLFDLRIASFICSNAPTFAYLYILSGERSTSPIIGGVQWMKSFGASPNQLGYHVPLPDFKFAISNQPTMMTQIEILRDNVNAQTIMLCVGGYLYDERMI